MIVSNLSLEQKLRSGALSTAEDIVQALVRVVQKCPCMTLILYVAQAYSSTGDIRQIVTGVAEKGAETVIRYWIQQSGSKKTAESKSRAVEKQGWAYLATHVSVRKRQRVRSN
jgi:hypothetical protein